MNEEKGRNDVLQRIEHIKLNFSTRNRWTKQDYSDFYFADVSFLLELVDKFLKITPFLMAHKGKEEHDE
jgi:hypothetical protein